MKRKKQIDKTVRPTEIQLENKMNEYKTQINKKLEPTEDLINMGINQVLGKNTSSKQVAAKKICYLAAKSITKLRQRTNALLAERRKIDRHSVGYREIDKGVKKAIKNDLKSHKTKMIQEAIENNMNMEVVRSKRTNERSLIHKI